MLCARILFLIDSIVSKDHGCNKYYDMIGVKAGVLNTRKTPCKFSYNIHNIIIPCNTI